MWVWLCIFLVAVVRRVITPAIADNSSYKQGGIRWKNLTFKRADSQNTSTLSVPSAAAVGPPQLRKLRTDRRQVWRCHGDYFVLLPTERRKLYTVHSVMTQKRDLTLHFSKGSHSERVAEDVMADLYPAFVFLLLPLCHLLRYQRLGCSVWWVCCLPACGAHGGAGHSSPKTHRRLSPLNEHRGGGERKGFTGGQISVVKRWLARVALPGSNRDYPSRRQTDSAI